MKSIVSDAANTTITLGPWPTQRTHAEPIRRAVFCVEQCIPESEEWDEWDARSVHAVAFDVAGKAIGTGRLKPDQMIGRMAVLQAVRGTGVGVALLDRLVEKARQMGFLTVSLNAQCVAQGFYERAGFVAEDAVFSEADIPHVLMRKALTI